MHASNKQRGREVHNSYTYTSFEVAAAPLQRTTTPQHTIFCSFVIDPIPQCLFPYVCRSKNDNKRGPPSPPAPPRTIYSHMGAYILHASCEQLEATAATTNRTTKGSLTSWLIFIHHSSSAAALPKETTGKSAPSGRHACEQSRTHNGTRKKQKVIRPLHNTG